MSKEKSVLASNESYLKETISLRHNIEGAFLELGERLNNIRSKAIWRGKYESYEEFLEDIKITPTIASRLVTVYTVYVLEHKVPIKKLSAVGYSLLYTAIPLLKEGNALEVVAKASELSRRDLEDELRDEKHGECNHDGDMEDYKRCVTCGKFCRVYEAK